MGPHTSPTRSRPRSGHRKGVRAGIEALRHIVQGIRLYSARAERQTGLSGAQLFVLQQLAEQPVQSLNELAARTCTHQSSVSTVVTRLVKRGLVSRKRAPDDARRLALELTPAGWALVATGPETAQTRLIAALERLPAAKRAALVEGLELLRAALGIQPGPAPLFLEPPRRRARRRGTRD